MCCTRLELNSTPTFKSKTNCFSFGFKIQRRTSEKTSGPRHTPNPSPLRNVWVQKITDKKLMLFTEKSC